MDKKTERILVSTAERRWLEEALGVSRKTVSEALNYRSSSEMAQKIRTLALKRGGQYIAPDAMATIFESNGDMVQTWGTSARLVAKRDTGEVLVTITGETPRHYPSMTPSELLAEQRRIEMALAR